MNKDEPRIVSPEEAQRYLDQPRVGHVVDDYLIEYAHTVATGPDRIRAAMALAWEEGYGSGANDETYGYAPALNPYGQHDSAPVVGRDGGDAGAEGSGISGADDPRRR